MKFLKYLIVISLYLAFVHGKNLKLLSCSSSFPEVCGPHATCEDDDYYDDLNESSHCECDSYAYGEPPNCKSKCEEDCSFDEHCDTDQKVCIKDCNEHEDCGIDEYCRFDVGDCIKGCRSHKSCKDNEFCDPHEKLCKIGCIDDDVCKADEYCDFDKNACTKGCRSHKSCKHNEFCDPDEKLCKIGCIDDDVCKADEYCDFDKIACTKGCRDDKSCEEDEYCDSFNDRLCKKGCREWPDNCKKGEFCNNHKCEKGCEHDTNCESNEVCNLSNKMCYSYCYKSTCGNNSLCSIVNHNRHCSCKPGYFPVSKVGCEPKGGSDSTSVSADNLDCQKYCGHKSLCGIEDDQISCYCSVDNGKNPFIDCSFLPPIPSTVPTVPLRPECIAALCG